MSESIQQLTDTKDMIGVARRVRTTDPDVFSDPDSARIAARNLGCIGIRRYLNRSGGESWMPCNNESDFRKYRGVGVSGRRFRRQQLEREIRQITGRSKSAEQIDSTDIEFKSKNSGNYTKPELRERIKQRIMAGSKGGAPGQWSARKAQMLAQAYKRAGGGYRSGGKSKPQRSISSWTQQRWTTSDGKKARRGSYTRRYLPAAAWGKLTPAQRAATNRKKIQGSRQGEQFVDNTSAARSARKRSVKGATHTAFYDAISTKAVAAELETKAAARRASRRALQTPGALKPRLNSIGRDLNPATARNADMDPYVLEGIPTVNRGRGVLDPTPGGKPSRWVPRVVPRAQVAPSAKPEKPKRRLARDLDALPKPPVAPRRRSTLSWLPDDSDKWTERDMRQLSRVQSESGQSYGEFARATGLFVDDVRNAVESNKSKRKQRMSNFKKRNPKLHKIVGQFGAVRAEAMDAISDGRVTDWPSLVGWAFKDPELRQQRLNDRAINDMFNNVSNGLDPDNRSDTVLGFIPSRTNPSEKVKTFAKAGKLPAGFEGRFRTGRETINTTRSVASVPERAARRSQQRMERISRPVAQTRAAYERIGQASAISGNMGISGNMATPAGPDSGWTQLEKATWRGQQWQKKLLFDSVFNSLNRNASPTLQAFVAKYPDKMTAARAVLELDDTDSLALFQTHWKELGDAGIQPPRPRAADLPLLPSEVEQAALIKRPLLRAFLDEYKKMAPNGTLARLDVDTLSNDDIEELFNRYILPELVDPTQPTTGQAQDIAQRILQPGNDNSPLRLLDNVLFMAGDDAFTLEGKRRILEERLAAGQNAGTLSPAASTNIQNQISAIDDELEKLLADAAAGRPLDTSIPYIGQEPSGIEPVDTRRRLPKWANERPAMTFEESPDEYIMFLLEHANDELGDHPEYGLITKEEWENWRADIEERQQKALEVYLEGGDLAAEDAINALDAEASQWEEIGRNSPVSRPPAQRWIPDGEEDEEPKEEPLEIYDEFGIIDEDWVWNSEYGSPEELGVTDDPATWVNHPDNFENGILFPLDELRDFINGLSIPQKEKDDILVVLEKSEWIDPHNSHIAQRYLPLISEFLDRFVSDSGGGLSISPTRGASLPDLGGSSDTDVGLSDPGGPRLRRNYPYILKNINWDAAAEMFKRITERLGGPTSQKGKYATASKNSVYEAGFYEDMSPQQLQNVFIEAAKQARETYLGQSNNSKSARQQMWDLLSAGKNADEIAQELVIFGVDQPNPNAAVVRLDINNDIVKAAVTQYAIENNIAVNQVSKLLDAANTAFNGDQSRQDALRKTQIERLKSTLEQMFPGQTPRQIADSIDGLKEAAQRQNEYANAMYQGARLHEAKLRMQLFEFGQTFPLPTARRPLYLENDGKTFTDNPGYGVPVFRNPDTDELTTDSSFGWPQAYDEGWDPTVDTRARLDNRQSRWWRQNYGYETEEILIPGTDTPIPGSGRTVKGPLRKLSEALSLHTRTYGDAGIAGVGAYIDKSYDARIEQLDAVQAMLTDQRLRSDASRLGISGFMGNVRGPNQYEQRAKRAARVLAGGRFKRRDVSELLQYDSDGFPVTRAMRQQYGGLAGKFMSAGDEFTLQNRMNPENIDFFKHLSPVEQQYFRSLYSSAQDLIAIPLKKPSRRKRQVRGNVRTPDEILIDAFYASIEEQRNEISGQMGLKRTLNKAAGMSKRNPERWQRQYMTARNSFRMNRKWSGRKKQNYNLDILEMDDSIFGPIGGLYVVDLDTQNVIDGPFMANEVAVAAGEPSAKEKAKGAMRRVIEQNYPRPWEQVPEVWELMNFGSAQPFIDFMIKDEHKLSDIRSTVNDRALPLDKGVPQVASDTAIFSRDPETGELMVLLIQRAYGPHRDDTGAWVLPGGFANPGETELETALRELEEELGIKVDPKEARVKQIGKIVAPDWDVRFTKGVEVSGTSLFVPSNIVYKAGDDALRAQWFSVEDIADGRLPIGFGHIAWIRRGAFLEKDEPAHMPFSPDTDTRLQRLERATRSRNKELIEISNSWREKMNKSRSKDDQIKLFDENNLGGFGEWEMIPSDDYVEMGVTARRKMFGRSLDKEDITGETLREAPGKRASVPSNFGPSITGYMGDVNASHVYKMHINGKTSNEIKGSMRGYSDDDISRAILASGITLSKTPPNLQDNDKSIFERLRANGESSADIARKMKMSIPEVNAAADRYNDVIQNTESPINKAFRKAVKSDKQLSGAEKEAITRRLNGSSMKDAASFLGIPESQYAFREAKIFAGIRKRNPSQFKSSGQWAKNLNSLLVDQEIFMRYVHDGRDVKKIAKSFGMTDTMVKNIAKRYARWRDSNAPLETSALRNALYIHGRNLTPSEAQLMRRVIDGESVSNFSKRTSTPYSAATRLYNNALRKMHMSASAAPKTRNFSANIFKAMPEHWMTPIMPADIDMPETGISGKMAKSSKTGIDAINGNKANQRLRGFVLAPLSDLRETALEVREEMRGKINAIPDLAMIGHPVFGGHEGVEKMNALGAYISRTLEDAALNGVLEAIRSSGNKFIPGNIKEEAAKSSVDKARRKLSEELWMKRDMMELVQSIHHMMDSASWPWMKWESDSPEWGRHKDVVSTMDMFDISTKSGRQKYMDAGFYLPLTRRETESFINKVYENNGISGNMGTPGPRRWAQLRDLYEVLDVDAGAAEEDLKKAYRKKARELHPDVNSNNPEATKKFQELSEAWETLSNTRNRNNYDEWRSSRTGATRRVSEEPDFTDSSNPAPRASEDGDPLNTNDLMTDSNGRVWRRHNPRIDDWPTAPFTDNTVFPQKQMTSEEFDEWSDWTRHRIQPSRPAGSALWGWSNRGNTDGENNIDDVDDDGFPTGGVRRPTGPQPGTPGDPFWNQVRDDLGPGTTNEEVAAEIKRRIEESRGDDDGRGYIPSDRVGSGASEISGRMASSLPPLDDSVGKRLKLTNLPSSYDNGELTKAHPLPTINAYAPKPNEPSVTVTTTFGGKTQLSQYRYDNVYKPIIEAMVAAVQQPSRRDKKRFVSVGGPAGSGKTTDRKSGAHGIPLPQFSMHVDADEIKTLIPEARALHAAGNPQWASAVHEESRIIADLALQQGIQNDLDVVYDSTGQYNSGFETLKAARLAGYDIVMHYNTASPESLSRNLEIRSTTDPRTLPGHFNAAVMNRNYEIMPAVAKSADEFYLWDSTDIGSRRLLVEKTDAKSPINVLDVNAYVHGKFDANGQTVKRGGRPTAKIPQMRFATGSMESKIIDRFEQGQSVDEIAAAMPAVPQDHIFDIVTLGYVDPNMVYTPPRPNQTPKPPMETAKKVDDFVEDDQLKSKWDSLDQSEKDIVKDVLAKKPNALDRFEETNMPMDIIIWAAQNGIAGNMGNARGAISGRITQPLQGWDSFNEGRKNKNSLTYKGKAWKDVQESLGGMPWPFKGQAEQFDKKGPPGFSYFKGEGNGLRPGQWVDCLLWRDEKGILKGIVYHYPQDLPLEKKGNVNIFISPDSKRKGIASTLLAEAMKLYDVNLRQQRYSTEGAAFVNNFVRRLPENSKKDKAS
jgi:curved DNA-binding protein CbpA/8-oxo-dGTP pyrophosphatase MutT (NUDIX family)/predicted ABC-type ATPase